VSSYSVPIPLDNDGFLRRQCPNCSKEFKWHDGPTEDRPDDVVDPDVYYCPRCGVSSPPGHWNTREQESFIEEWMQGPIFREASDEIGKMLGNMKGVTYTENYENEPGVPESLHEPNDMVILMSPCHSWEPIKVPQGATGRVYCLVCGEPFTA